MTESLDQILRWENYVETLTCKQIEAQLLHDEEYNFFKREYIKVLSAEKQLRIKYRKWNP